MTFLHICKIAPSIIRKKSSFCKTSIDDNMKKKTIFCVEWERERGGVCERARGYTGDASKLMKIQCTFWLFVGICPEKNCLFVFFCFSSRIIWNSWWFSKNCLSIYFYFLCGMELLMLFDVIKISIHFLFLFFSKNHNLCCNKKIIWKKNYESIKKRNLEKLNIFRRYVFCDFTLLLLYILYYNNSRYVWLLANVCFLNFLFHF